MEYIILNSIIFLYGIVIGSFLNVCIYRIPAKESTITRRSHCMCCGNVLKWYELIPLFSYLFQRGKCRHCQSRISIQYPLVECTNAIFYVLVFNVKGFTPESIIYCLCASTLLVITLIDWRTYEIPLSCNVMIGLLGIIHGVLDRENWLQYVVGFFTVSGLFYIIYIITKGRGIGGGDIKLMAAAGLLLGWQNVLLALVIGSVAGSIIHVSLMKLKGKDRVLAFGPYLSAGIFIAMLYGDQIIKWYLSLYL